MPITSSLPALQSLPFICARQKHFKLVAKEDLGFADSGFWMLSISIHATSESLLNSRRARSALHQGALTLRILDRIPDVLIL